jgi:signal transduction histidine kinase
VNTIVPVNPGDQELAGREPDHASEVPASSLSEASSDSMPSWVQSYAICFAIMVLSFVVDIMLPRGATAAIGYCLIPVLARAPRRGWFLLSLTGLCTLLTWIGYLLERPGATWWMSAFDRGMVTAVLWLTLWLVWRRMEAEIALRHAVRELRRSNRDLEDFSSVVSHDIRGPLYSISMAASIISSQPSVASDAESKKLLDSIVAEISRICGLAESLLAYARIGAGKVKLSDCNCESVLNDVRQSLRAQLENAGAELTNDALPTLGADPALMTELLQNLIENSIRYCATGPPRIHVSATATEEGWCISVHDNGIGMNAEECARAFDRFYQGAAAESSVGCGLGLATCKRIVHRHGGRIDVHSEPGHGCTFSFIIPVHENVRKQ